MAANASFTRLNTGNDDNIYAFLRQQNGRKVLVVTNLSAQPQTFRIANASVAGEATNVFDRSTKQITPGENMQLEAWGYRVYEYR